MLPVSSQETHAACANLEDMYSPCAITGVMYATCIISGYFTTSQTLTVPSLCSLSQGIGVLCACLAPDSIITLISWLR